MQQYSWLYTLCGILLILSFVLRVFDAQIKGWYGEMLVRFVLNRLDKEKYNVINNLYIKSASGNVRKAQIDHVVVSTFGVFVIETKNYKGKIYGTERATKWQQYIGGRKYEFYNPLRQNYGHQKSLELWLEENGAGKIPVFPILVFTGDAKLKKVPKDRVICLGQLKKKIRDLSVEEVMSKEQASEIAEILRKDGIPEFGDRKAHIKEIKKIEKEQES